MELEGSGRVFVFGVWTLILGFVEIEFGIRSKCCVLLEGLGLLSGNGVGSFQ